MKRKIFLLSVLFLSHVAFSGERFTNPKIVYKTGELHFDIPEWVDFTDYEQGQKVETSDGQIFYIAGKDGWISSYGRMVKIFLRKESDLNKGLLYFTGSEMSTGVFDIYKASARAGNSICFCTDPACQAGVRTVVPDRTYRSSFKGDNDTDYSITFIIQDNALTVTVMNDKEPLNCVKITYDFAASFSS